MKSDTKMYQEFIKNQVELKNNIFIYKKFNVTFSIEKDGNCWVAKEDNGIYDEYIETHHKSKLCAIYWSCKNYFYKYAKI